MGVAELLLSFVLEKVVLVWWKWVIGWKSREKEGCEVCWCVLL